MPPHRRVTAPHNSIRTSHCPPARTVVTLLEHKRKLLFPSMSSRGALYWGVWSFLSPCEWGHADFTLRQNLPTSGVMPQQRTRTAERPAAALLSRNAAWLVRVIVPLRLIASAAARLICCMPAVSAFDDVHVSDPLRGESSRHESSAATVYPCWCRRDTHPRSTTPHRFRSSVLTLIVRLRTPFPCTPPDSLPSHCCSLRSKLHHAWSTGEPRL